ncbi:Electron transporter protein (fragment) [Crenothrix polyspora]|uniref:Electron transporter protein n=1 Tax=Crenothrix polyspora TaxID=360316 RepID=A0A1R4HI85_9GAMM
MNKLPFWLLLSVMLPRIGMAASSLRLATPTQLSVPDVAVVDQMNQPLHFYRDLLKGKVVAISFIYAACTTFCPLTGVVFSKAQQSLRGQLGKSVQLVSISLDPANDTPDQLAAWGKKFNAQAGWSLVTGHQESIEQLLKAFNVALTAKEDHPPVLVVGDTTTNQWVWINSLVSAEQLVDLVNSLHHPK